MNCVNHPDREKSVFCQQCGKPLCPECGRPVSGCVYCEPCLAEHLAASEGTTTAPPSYPDAPVAGAPNPLFAGLLGLIPGVGAMYNGQYAKGFVHLTVFVVFVSLAQSFGLFHLFAIGWVFYQAIEAYHTARARRDGTPLPNPFGLNDIGERLGFTRPHWTGSPATPPPTPPPSAAAPPYASSTYTAPDGSRFQKYPDGSQTYVGADGSQFRQSPDGSQVYVDADGTSFTQGAGYQAYTAPNYPNYGTTAQYTHIPVPPAPACNPASPIRRFPVGAGFLIVLGLLFFVGSFGWFRIHLMLPFVLIAIGVWIFVRHLSFGIYSPTEMPASYRVMRALRPSIWVIMIGVLFLLASFNILPWSRSWPLLLITAGLTALLQRLLFNATPLPPYPFPGAGGPSAAPFTPPPSAAAPPGSEETR